MYAGHNQKGHTMIVRLAEDFAGQPIYRQETSRTDKNRQEPTGTDKKLFIINYEYNILKNDLLVLF